MTTTPTRDQGVPCWRYKAIPGHFAASGFIHKEEWEEGRWLSLAADAARERVVEKAALLLDELDDFLPLVDDLDCGQPVNGEEFTAYELATKQRLADLRAALAALGGADEPR